MGSLSGNKSRSGNQSSSTVWEGMAPFLTDLYGKGQGLYENFQPQTGIPGQAQAAYGQMLQPQGNPYLEQMAGGFQDQLGRMNQQTGGQAALTGGYGGGRHGIAESQNVQNMGQQMGQFYGQQYQGDQNRALGALGQSGQMMGMSPEMQRMQYLQGYGNLVGGPHNEMQSSGKSSSKGGGIGIG